MIFQQPNHSESPVLQYSRAYAAPAASMGIKAAGSLLTFTPHMRGHSPLVAPEASIGISDMHLFI